MNNIVLAQIFDGVNSMHSLEQISQSLHISIDEILDGLEELVRKEIAPNVNYLMESGKNLSEEQFKRLDQIRIKSVYNKVYQQTAYDDDTVTEEVHEFWAELNAFFERNEYGIMAAAAREGATLESLEENSNFTRAEIISLIKKAVVEDKIKTDVRHMIAQASNEEEKNELLLIQQLSDQIPIKTDVAEKYIPEEERKLSKEAEEMCGSYAEYFDPSGNDEDKQELTKWVCIMRKKELCKRHDIEYRPNITEEEICAGIYLYLLSQGYSDIRTTKFFPSAYEAMNFYATNKKGSKDVWGLQTDPNLFDDED